MTATEDDKARSFLIGQAEIAARPLEPALYLVATPIGNLGDITLRALETLTAADILAAEDTRVTRILLDRYGIRRRAFAYHEHNEAEAGKRLLEALRQGKSVALVSDAGTPLVSDPGYRLAVAAIAEDIRIVPLPGASAVLAALAASGLPSDTFLFGGFLPAKDAARRTRLEELQRVPATLIFFESPHRLAATLAAMADIFGRERKATVARELTKRFEEVRRGSIHGLNAHYSREGAPKGEIVILVAPPEPSTAPSAGEIDALLLSLSTQMAASKAAGETARMTGVSKQDLYRRLLELKEADGA